MRHVLKIAVPLVLMALIAPAQAEQSGKWRGKAVLVTTSATESKIPGKPDHAVETGTQDGIIFNEDGSDFLATARYQVNYLFDSEGMVQGGYKTFTTADDSKVFARFALREAAYPILRGNWTFLSGTGKYQGISGSGTYEVHFVADGVLWDILEGEYKLP
jgi:hypothetical protein